MEGFIEIFTNVWEEGFLGIGITEIIVSMLIFIAGAISRAFFVGRVLNWLEKLTAHTDSEVDDVLLESLKKPLGYIPMTVALYFIAVYLPLSGMADIFATNLVKAMIAFTIFSALSNSIAPIFQAFTSSAVLTKSMTMWLERAARIIIWIIGLGIILDIFGIQIGPLVAGLGLYPDKNGPILADLTQENAEPEHFLHQQKIRLHRVPFAAHDSNHSFQSPFESKSNPIKTAQFTPEDQVQACE